jgi:hypothetical protein
MTGCSWVALAISFFSGMFAGILSLGIGCLVGGLIREGNRMALSEEERRRIQREECG